MTIADVDVPEVEAGDLQSGVSARSGDPRRTEGSEVRTAARAEQTDVAREAFYLESQGAPLFAWLHQAADQLHGDHGVVVLPPLGFEQLHAQRGLRHLADQIARLRIPALRIDWHGTGDSVGDDFDSARIQTWLANVRSAVRWMKEHCSRVSVIGLRLGATLASLALGDDDVENLILWAPVVNGRGYVREMTVIDMMSEAPPDGTEVPGTVEAAGFRMSDETVAELSKVSVLRSRPKCQRILIARRDDAPPDQRLIDHFRGLGIAVEERVLPGVAQMLLEPHKALLPTQAIHDLTEWLRSNVSVEASLQPIDATHQQHSMELSVADTTIRETPWWINPSPDLFGIVCEPTNESNDLPTIVLLNAGAAYHIGPGRMNVEMARQFATDGYRCVRLDLCGLGDSVPVDVTAENDSYPSTAFRDIQIALEAVRRRYGCQRIVLMGLCSGAYASFQSAVQFADSTLVESVLINPLTYFWRDGMSLETAPTEQLIREHYYLTSALQPAKWVKLLSGRSSIGIRGAVRMVAQRLLGKKRHKAKASCELACQCPSHPQVDDLTDDLLRLAATRRQVSMFFSTTDPGYSILTTKAGKQARQMLQSGQLQAHFTDNADHTFSRYTARRRLIQALCDHLNRRYRAAK